MASNSEDDFDVTKVNSTFLVMYHIAEKGVQTGAWTLTFRWPRLEGMQFRASP